MQLVQLSGATGYNIVQIQVFQKKFSSSIELISSDIAFFFLKHLYWSIIALQCCVSFCCMTLPSLRNSPTLSFPPFPEPTSSFIVYPLYLVQTLYHIIIIQKVLLKIGLHICHVLTSPPQPFLHSHGSCEVPEGHSHSID